MENAHGYREHLRGSAAVIAVAGAAALAGAGCTSPERPDALPAGEPTPAVTIEVDPGTDALPLVEEYDHLPSPSSTSYVDPGMLNTVIKYNEPGEEFEKYSLHMNNDENPKTVEDDLPSYDSAPVLDVEMGTDGKLHYKDHIESNSVSSEEVALIKAISSTSPVLLPAMRAGEVHAVHIRVFEPDQYPDEPEWEPTVHAQFIPRDVNDEGKPSIYYYLPASDLQDTETVKLILEHEVSHAMLKQLAETGEDIPVTGEEKATFVAACNVIREQALQNVADSSTFILSDLYTMRDMSKPGFRASYNKVITAIENSTYEKLPVNPHYAGTVPECYTQSPWEAVLVDARKKKLSAAHITEDTDRGEFDRVANDMLEEWNDLLKQGTIYGVLSESAYLEGDSEKIWGHPYDNAHELGASTTNLAIQVPEELGENVAALTDDQRAVVKKLISFNIQKLKNGHPNEPDFHKYLDEQLAKFTAAAGR